MMSNTNNNGAEVVALAKRNRVAGGDKDQEDEGMMTIEPQEEESRPKQRRISLTADDQQKQADKSQAGSSRSPNFLEGFSFEDFLDPEKAESKVDSLLAMKLGGEYATDAEASPALPSAQTAATCGDDFAKVKGGLYLVSAMKLNSDKLSFQAKCCKLILDLTCNNDANQQSLLNAGVASAIVSAMKINENHLTLQIKACHALQSLAISEEQQRTGLLQAGAGQAVIRAMMRFPDEREVQLSGCSVLQNLAYSQHEQRDALVKANGAEVVVRAMKQFGSDRHVLLSACGVIQNLAYEHTEHRVALLQAGAADALVQAMPLLLEDREFQCSACGTLVNLTDSAEEDEGGSNQQISQSTATAILSELGRSMNKYADDAQLQLRACAAVGYLVSYHHYNEYDFEAILPHLTGALTRFGEQNRLIRHVATRALETVAAAALLVQQQPGERECSSLSLVLATSSSTDASSSAETQEEPVKADWSASASSCLS